MATRPDPAASVAEAAERLIEACAGVAAILFLPDQPQRQPQGARRRRRRTHPN